ncbi:MAG: type I phosphomannose isomerase catalytic subunit [Bacteroidales bacterium]|jgi:mannose-6-phosphate isomerase|nr:class I mannose-6-phosphate isomerase [Bacteroidales bacterium]
MRTLYPLKFKPIFKEKIWGGKKIATVLNQDFATLTNCGELWAISGVEGSESIVANGFLKGNTLPELLEVYMGDLVGERVYEKFGNEFPLLFKFINSEDFLSVQVHPNDELALSRHQSLGKTEMWYIIDADDEASLICGFKNTIDKNKFLKNLSENKLKDILNFEPVVKGDVFYMPSGMVHAIGPGILLAEIQQSSDITYRIYDWDRFDHAGLKRELHTELALDAIDFKSDKQCKTHPVIAKNRPVLLQQSEYFTVNLIDTDKQLILNYSDKDTLVVLMCIGGSCKIQYNEGQEKLNPGETLLIPAEMIEIELNPDKFCKILETYIE